MRLDVYLKKLESCPGELLTQRCGLYDNWPVFFNCDIGTMAKCFSEPNYTFTRKADEIKLHFMEFIYNKGIVTIQLRNCLKGFVYYHGHPIGTIHEKKQKESFSASLMLYALKRGFPINDYESFKSMTEIIRDIVLFVKKEKIALCFPKSQGKNSEEIFDFSKIVYYFPRGVRTT